MASFQSILMSGYWRLRWEKKSLITYLVSIEGVQNQAQTKMNRLVEFSIDLPGDL